MKQLISQYPSAAIRKLEDYPHNPPEHENITYYRSQVTITLFHQDIVGDSKKYFLNTQISREEAIKDAILQVSLQESKFNFRIVKCYGILWLVYLEWCNQLLIVSLYMQSI